jgi:uncharacterized protein (TIGR00369 family)
MASELSVQERHAPGNACFGCGQANPKGLRLRSFERGDELVAEWRAEKHHEGYDGVLSGGATATLLDCHATWTAVMHLLRAGGHATPPCAVTAELSVRYLRPTPTEGPVSLAARVVESAGDRVTVEGSLTAAGKVRATCRGTFVQVKEGHPAYHGW